jgi:hypothetical protein
MSSRDGGCNGGLRFANPPYGIDDDRKKTEASLPPFFIV